VIARTGAGEDGWTCGGEPAQAPAAGKTCVSRVRQSVVGMTIAKKILVALLVTGVFLLALVSKDDSGYALHVQPLRNFRLAANAGCGYGREVVWLVTSHAGNANLRAAQRESASYAELEAAGIRRVFILARAANVSVEDEAGLYGDLLVGDFHESYHRLHLKHVMGLKWAADSCADAK